MKPDVRQLFEQKSPAREIRVFQQAHGRGFHSVHQAATAVAEIFL